MLMQYWGGGAFGGALQYLEWFGVLQIFLPFLLICTVLFAVLEKIKLFGDEAYVKRYNGVIALAIALLVVLPPYFGYTPMGFDAVRVINEILPQFAIIALAMVMLLMVVGIGTGTGSGTLVSHIISFGALLFLVYVIYRSITYNDLPWWLQMIADPGVLMFLVMIGAFIWVISMIMGDSSTGTATSRDTSKSLKDFFNALFSK